MWSFFHGHGHTCCPWSALHCVAPPGRLVLEITAHRDHPGVTRDTELETTKQQIIQSVMLTVRSHSNVLRTAASCTSREMPCRGRGFFVAEPSTGKGRLNAPSRGWTASFDLQTVSTHQGLSRPRTRLDSSRCADTSFRPSLETWEVDSSLHRTQVLESQLGRKAAHC